MKKKVYICLEIMKFLIFSGGLIFVNNAVIFYNSANTELVMIGQSFLVMISTLVISSIIMDILISFFLPREKNTITEWELIVNNKVLRNFAYALSLFYVAVMVAFALNLSQKNILLFLQIGFLCLLGIVNFTKAYYYEG